MGAGANANLSAFGNFVKRPGNGWSTMYVRGSVSSGIHEWKHKILKASRKGAYGFGFGITNMKDGSLDRLIYKELAFSEAMIVDADGNVKIVKQCVKNQDIVTVKANFYTMRLSFYSNGAKFGSDVTIPKGQYKAFLSL